MSAEMAAGHFSDAQQAKARAPALLRSARLVTGLERMGVEPRLLPAAHEVMSAEIACGDFGQ
jgi:hypothetical protein